MAKEAKEKDDARRMAAKPPQKCQDFDSDEELLAATLQLEQLQCGQAQVQGQGEHQEGGAHDGDQQGGQEEGVEEAKLIPDLKPSIDRAQSPVEWNQGPKVLGRGYADGQDEHHVDGAHQVDHPNDRAQDQEHVHQVHVGASIIMPTTPSPGGTGTPVGRPRTPSGSTTPPWRTTPPASPPRTPSPTRGCTPVRVVCTPLWKRKRLSAQMSSSISRSKQRSQSKPDSISKKKSRISAATPSSQPEDTSNQNASPGSFYNITSCAAASIAPRPINPEQSASTPSSRTEQAGKLTNSGTVSQRMV